MPSDNVKEIADLLHQAGEVHHVYFADTEGNDDDWATFYSQWLLHRTRLPQLLARTPVRSGLTRDLVVSDEEYVTTNPGDPWPLWYAQRLIAKYGSA